MRYYDDNGLGGGGVGSVGSRYEGIPKFRDLGYGREDNLGKRGKKYETKTASFINDPNYYGYNYGFIPTAKLESSIYKSATSTNLSFYASKKKPFIFNKMGNIHSSSGINTSKIGIFDLGGEEKEGAACSGGGGGYGLCKGGRYEVELNQFYGVQQDGGRNMLAEQTIGTDSGACRRENEIMNIKEGLGRGRDETYFDFPNDESFLREFFDDEWMKDSISTITKSNEPVRKDLNGIIELEANNNVEKCTKKELRARNKQTPKRNKTGKSRREPRKTATKASTYDRYKLLSQSTSLSNKFIINTDDSDSDDSISVKITTRKKPSFRKSLPQKDQISQKVKQKNRANQAQHHMILGMLII